MSLNGMVRDKDLDSGSESEDSSALDETSNDERLWRKGEYGGKDKGDSPSPSLQISTTPIDMEIDTHEHVWTRIHDIEVTADVLEYTGEGRKIEDNGIAQANFPLSPTSHYFEVEILDPGECCYIAIGIAQKDYPLSRHPGWQVGSVAFHADDGKLFTGRGMGSAFGPRCVRGDVLGCGIVFPVQYSDPNPDERRERWAWEPGERVLGKPRRDRSPGMHREDRPRRGLQPAGDHPFMWNEQMLEVWNMNDDSDEEVLWLNENEISDIKVKVFFRRNNKYLGIREVRVPRGGYFPTIGMLSKGEKVRVDLCPLSG